MRLEKPQSVDFRQWLARMGVTGEADESLRQSMKTEEKKLLSAAEPKGIYRVFQKGDLALKGNGIKRHLQDCREMILLGVTLGAGVDQLLRSSQIRDMASAVILDCGASVLIEQICDRFQEEIRQETGLFLTSRYSPGYGDFPIETQDELIRLLDGPRKIGLTVNQNHILIPRKSVTAVIGAADHPVKGYLATCGECAIREICALRKEGKNCAEF